MLERGEKLPREVIRARGVTGHLVVWGNVFDRTRTAELLACLNEQPDGGRELMAPLSKARLRYVKGAGLCLSGTEHVRALDERRRVVTSVYDQAWWCVPIQVGSTQARDDE